MSPDFGLAELEANEKTIARVPNLFLLDSSWSMSEETKDLNGNTKQAIEQVNEGMELFTEEIGSERKAKWGVDVSVVSFGGDVSVEQDFKPIQDAWMEGSEPPELAADGTTPMNKAIVKGLQNLQTYKDAVDKQGLSRKRALVWLLTDGQPDNGPGTKQWDKAQSLIEQGTEEDRLFFYAVGIGDEADMDTLDELVSAADDEQDVAAFKLDENMFKEFFRVASNSASGSVTGESESAEDALEDDSDAISQQDVNTN